MMNVQQHEPAAFTNQSPRVVVEGDSSRGIDCDVDSVNEGRVRARTLDHPTRTVGMMNALTAACDTLAHTTTTTSSTVTDREQRHTKQVKRLEDKQKIRLQRAKTDHLHNLSISEVKLHLAKIEKKTREYAMKELEYLNKAKKLREYRNELTNRYQKYASKVAATDSGFVPARLPPVLPN